MVDGAIPAFALAEGNPARVVGWRLPEELRTALEGFSLNALAPVDADAFFARLTPANVREQMENNRR